MMVFVELLCLLMLSSNIVIADTSTCMPQLSQRCSCMKWRDPCFKVTSPSHGFLGPESCVELRDGSDNCKLTRLSHTIPMSFSNNIIELTINASIEAIDPGIFNKFPKIQCLNLAQNHIQMISSTMFTNLTDLHRLDLGYNWIRYVFWLHQSF